jgi:Flp pilus assembly pilin Flp
VNNKLRNLLNKLKSDQRGLSTVEYVVLLVLIVAIAVALWNVFGNSMTSKLQSATNAFDGNVQTGKKAEKGVVGAGPGDIAGAYEAPK